MLVVARLSSSDLWKESKGTQKGHWAIGFVGHPIVSTKRGSRLQWQDRQSPCVFASIAANHAVPPKFGTDLRTLALKTEDFGEKIGRFSKTTKWIY